MRAYAPPQLFLRSVRISYCHLRITRIRSSSSTQHEEAPNGAPICRKR
nr:MAG TPA: hypothetical protein [Caudoviricetes sp.]